MDYDESYVPGISQRELKELLKPLGHPNCRSQNLTKRIERLIGGSQTRRTSPRISQRELKAHHCILSTPCRGSARISQRELKVYHVVVKVVKGVIRISQRELKEQ